MDLGHYGLESQTDLQPEVGSDPNRSRRMPQNITDAPKTRDFGPRVVQKLSKQLLPEHFSFIFAVCVRCLPFWNFRRRVNSDRLLGRPVGLPVLDYRWE